MSLSGKPFHSKLLLLGEYTVLKGSSALVLPMRSFSAKFINTSETDPRIQSFADYARTLSLDGVRVKQQKLDEALSKGLSLQSNIKTGYGLGSSGALCAAFLHEFALIEDRLDLINLKQVLATLESYFHGKSSGVDALCSYIDDGILITKDNGLELVDFNWADVPGNFYLLDSGRNRSTQQYVDHFKTEIDVPKHQKTLQGLQDLNDQGISMLIDVSIESNQAKLRDILIELSKLQYQLFEYMIPEEIRNIWHFGLKSNQYFMKILGAGGGGYFMLYADSNVKINKELPLQLIGHYS